MVARETQHGLGREPRMTALAWLSVMLPPIAWATSMQINYMLTPFECYGGSRFPLYVINVVALLLSVTGGAIGLHLWRRQSYEWANESNDPKTRNRFLAVLGMLMSGNFTLVILAQGIAIVVFHPCLP